MNLELEGVSLRKGITDIHTPQLQFLEGTTRNDLQMQRTPAHTARRPHQAIPQLRVLETLHGQKRPSSVFHVSCKWEAATASEGTLAKLPTRDLSPP